MIFLKPCFHYFLALSLSLAIAAPAFAGSENALNIVTVTVNPETLREMMEQSNVPTQIELNQVLQAKDSVEINRGNILPKLSLGAAIISITHGPAFILSAVSVLLPFFLPTNWANLHQSEYLLESEKYSYLLLKLNLYASAYSLYMTILGDMSYRDVLEKEYQIYLQIENNLKVQRNHGFDVSDEDIKNADASAQIAKTNVSSVDELLSKEKAAFAEVLAVKPGTRLEFQKINTAPSPMEGEDLDRVISRVQHIAPENQQIDEMIRAGIENLKSQSWNVFTGTALNANATSSSGAINSLNNVSASAGFNIGFNYGPTVKLAGDAIAQIKLQGKKLLLDEQEIAQQTIDSIIEAKNQVATASAAENDYDQVYRDQLIGWNLGKYSLQTVLITENNRAQASALRVKAQEDLNNLRITLHRELLTDQFADIPTCKIKSVAEVEDHQFFFGIFGSSGIKNWSMDDVCEPTRYVPVLIMQD